MIIEMNTREVPDFLREWAERMPIALQNIIVATKDVISAYQYVLRGADNIYRDEFNQMLLNVKIVKKDSEEAILSLCIQLREVAYKLDCYNNIDVDL